MLRSLVIAVGAPDGLDGEQFFQKLLSRGSKHEVGDLGNGTFRYEGAQAKDCPELTMWKFQLYGGVDFGDSTSPEPASLAVGVTGPAALIGDRGVRRQAVVCPPPGD